MNSAGALRRSWKPVARMVVWQLQGSVVQAPVRGFTTTVTSVEHFLPSGVIEKGLFFGGPGSRSGSSIAWRSSSMASGQVRFASSNSGAVAKDGDEAEEETLKEGLSSEHPAVRKAAREMVRSNYWGVTTPSFTREDGTKWPWNCFRPGDTYETDHSVDIDKHHIPQNFEEKVALRFVKALRIPVDLFFMKRYGCRAMMLETVAAVPGMVGGMLLHLRSLRRFEQSGGWIKALLDEAENERMHLMTLLEVVKPNWYERLLVVAVQGVFFNAYFIFYLLSPRMAHRFTGYLEEEAIWSYTHFLKNIDNGNVENVPAPKIAIDYWRLPKDAKLREVILALRADEAHHRDVNHYASDIRMEGKQLSESPAPVDYH